MTREYFIDNVTEWRDLLEFCDDEGCDVCSCIIDSTQLDEYVNDDMASAIRDGAGWLDMYGWLDDIRTGWDYYRMNSSFDYEPLDERDITAYKDEVIDWMDNNGLWDEEDDDEEDAYEECPKEPEEPPVEEEDFSVQDLISMCGSELLSILQAIEQHKKEEHDNMISLLAV